jgi:hypothetical protein
MTRLAICLLLLLPLAGCGMGETLEDPVYELEPEDAMVIMPFKDPDFPVRWESPQGNETALRTTEVLQREAEFRVLGYEEVLGLFQAEKVNEFGPKDVAANTGADFVLVCDIEEFRLQDPMTFNMRQGFARVKVRLFHVEKRSGEEEARLRERAEEQNEARRRAGLPPVEYDRGGRFIPDAERTVEARFPSDFYSPAGETFMELDEIRTGLTLTMARKVAQLYFVHPKEKIETE